MGPFLLLWVQNIAVSKPRIYFKAITRCPAALSATLNGKEVTREI